jgi:predicted MFS family arabinose efflux permease
LEFAARPFTAIAVERLVQAIETDPDRSIVSTRQTAKAPAQKGLSAATRATYVAFIGCGFAFASWASRIPQVRDRLHLTSADLGLVLLTIAAGSIMALLLAGVIVSRFHSRRTVTAMAALQGAALAAVALGYLAGVVPVVVGLFVFGFSTAAWDVAMNVQGAAVERRLGRAIMPRFHAGYSIGTVAGALVGAAMVALHVPVTAHLLAVAVAVAVVIPAAVRSFLPDIDDPDTAQGAADAKGTTAKALRRWAEPRTLLVGIVVLAFAFAEGAGIDWISLSLIDGYQLPAVLGTLGFAAFLASMTIGRWFADGVLARYGRVAVIRGQTVLAIVGVLVFVVSPTVPLAFAGVLLWGVGASLGFPVGMSAAADDPSAAAGRVSVVASIGYCAFLGGPPLIGYLGQNVTVLRALVAVAVVLGLATLVTGALRPLAVQSPDQQEVG